MEPITQEQLSGMDNITNQDKTLIEGVVQDWGADHGESLDTPLAKAMRAFLVQSFLDMGPDDARRDLDQKAAWFADGWQCAIAA